MCKLRRCIYPEVRCELCEFKSNRLDPAAPRIKGSEKAWDDEVNEILELIETTNEEADYYEVY